MKPITVEQAREVPLDLLCLSVARLYLHDKTQLSGSLMAHLAGRLIEAESQPGGPYHGPNGMLDFPTNLTINYLFACFGKPLPNVTLYIAKQREKVSLSPSVKKLLYQYDHTMTKNKSKKRPLSNIDHRAIFTTAKKELARLLQPEKQLALTFLPYIQQADTTREIAHLPTIFANSLIAPPPLLPLHQLGKANIYCWIAYSIYDKLLDDEPATEYLPAANITMRMSLQIYQNLFPSAHPFQQTTLSTFAAMDHANAWEITNCRYKRAGESIVISHLPQYGQNSILAMRSSGHILGPLAIAALAQLPEPASKKLEKALHHYLIARQLSDDIHDWQEDVTAGHASSVVVSILTHLALQPGTYQLPELTEQMQADFWNHSMEAINKNILRHLRLSRQLLLKSGVIKKDAEFFTILARLESSALESNSERARYQDFLNSYQTQPTLEINAKTLPQLS